MCALWGEGISIIKREDEGFPVNKSRLIVQRVEWNGLISKATNDDSLTCLVQHQSCIASIPQWVEGISRFSMDLWVEYLIYQEYSVSLALYPVDKRISIVLIRYDVRVPEEAEVVVSITSAQWDIPITQLIVGCLKVIIGSLKFAIGGLKLIIGSLKFIIVFLELPILPLLRSKWVFAFFACHLLYLWKEISLLTLDQ